MIEVENLSIAQGAFHLQSVSFDVPTGDYAVLMGKTGSGKTTLLEAICGLRPITQGRIILGDRDVTQLKPALRGVGYVPQDAALFSHMTVAEHLAFALTIRGWGYDSMKKRVQELAGLLGISHLLTRYPSGLSGGEAQRVALGRALSFHPQILCLDEPLSALDDDTREQMYELLLNVQRETGVTVLHITHSAIESDHLADRLILLQQGACEVFTGKSLQLRLRALAHPPNSALFPAPSSAQPEL